MRLEAIWRPSLVVYFLVDFAFTCAELADRTHGVVSVSDVRQADFCELCGHRHEDDLPPRSLGVCELQEAVKERLGRCLQYITIYMLGVKDHKK